MDDDDDGSGDVLREKGLIRFTFMTEIICQPADPATYAEVTVVHRRKEAES